jgi:hypothetical protein
MNNLILRSIQVLGLLVKVLIAILAYIYSWVLVL